MKKNDVDLNLLLKVIEIIAISAIPILVFYISLQSTSYQIEQNEMEHQPSWDIGEYLDTKNNESSFQCIEVKYNDNYFTLVNSSADCFVVVDIYPQKNYDLSSANRKFLVQDTFLTIYIPIFDFYGEKGIRDRSNNSILFYPSLWKEEGKEVPSYQSQYLVDFMVMLQTYMWNRGIEGDIHINKYLTISYVDVYKKWRTKNYFSPVGGEFYEVEDLSSILSRSTDYLYFPSNISGYTPYNYFGKQIDDIFTRQINLTSFQLKKPRNLTILNDDAEYSNGIIDYNAMIFENNGGSSIIERINWEMSHVLKNSDESPYVNPYYQNRINHAMNVETRMKNEASEENQ